MEHFGHTLRALRESRRLSQDRLADAAIVSKMTILRAEQAAKCTLRRTTLTAVFEALEKARRLSASEERAWLSASGMGPLVAHVRRMIEEQGFPAPGPDPESQAHAAVERLSRIHGAHRVLALLESIEMIAGHEPNADAPPFDVNVVHPPVQRQGYTEQVITHYDRESPQAAAVPPITQAAPKRKRA